LQTRILTIADLRRTESEKACGSEAQRAEALGPKGRSGVKFLGTGGKAPAKIDFCAFNPAENI